jgi:hypothetical protein
MADRYVGEDLARSIPAMRLLERAGQGGNSLLEFLQKLQGQGRTRELPSQGGNDALMRQRGQMSELEYRKYLDDQLRQGQQMQQSLPVPASK